MNDDATAGKPCPCPEDRVAGMEIRGVYDGILFWLCMNCDARWHRWPEDSHLRARAERHINDG